jgi:TrmH family RNA methyltransferase
MISKARFKYIKSLEQKKVRQSDRLFVAEGPKVVGDILRREAPLWVVSTDGWAAAHADELPASTELMTVSDDELRRLSFLQHPQQVLAVFAIPDRPTVALPLDDLSLALDGVQDPGNLGTIVRIADWFGIRHIVCSRDTADLYNPKVVQATMGSLARVEVAYTDLPQLVDSLPDDFPVYGTLLDGHNIYAEPLQQRGLIVMGNEGKGLTEPMRERVTHRLFIPNYPEGSDTAESLNVAIATAVTCAEFRRRGLTMNYHQTMK